MCEKRLYGYFPPDINFQLKSDFTNGKMKRFHQHHQEEQFLNELELFYPREGHNNNHQTTLTPFDISENINIIVIKDLHACYLANQVHN